MTDTELQIVTELAATRPTTETYQGETVCFFCSAIEDDNDKVTHDETCLWLRAQRWR